MLMYLLIFFFLMVRRPPRSTLSSSSAASDVYKRQGINAEYGGKSRDMFRALRFLAAGGVTARTKMISCTGSTPPSLADPMHQRLSGAAGTDHTVENKLLRMVQALHDRGYPCRAHCYMAPSGMHWRFTLGEYRYSSSTVGDLGFVDAALARRASPAELADRFLETYPLEKAQFSAEDMEFQRWWRAVCGCVGTEGVYSSFRDLGGPELHFAGQGLSCEIGTPPDFQDRDAAMTFTSKYEDVAETKKRAR
eukprot:TRINITY_DN17643_c0_g1_i2.p1 TRINITY_DN17643_c0_g1~~TRINITY_DN17643_c0_g1_i2.p1  ORF type:complete len:250 (-),score=44.65 TRINITY_DN17643_c0_g1_i2:326-1075(-)